MPRLILVLWILTLPNCSQVGQCRKTHVKLRIFPGHLVPRFDFVDDCKNVTLASRLRNVSLSNGSSKMLTLNGVLEINRWVQRITKVIVQVENCESAIRATCQHFQTLRFYDELCRLIAMKGQPWSPTIQNFHPPFRCPIAPGNYTLTNGTLDMGQLRRLPYPLEQFYWRTRFEAYDPQLYYCVEMGCRFLRSRT